jgi:hypothetical protein
MQFISRLILVIGCCLVFVPAYGEAPPVNSAYKSFKKKKYGKAADQFWRILAEAEEGTEEFEAATYFLGQSLYKMGYRHAGIEHLYSIVRFAGNTDFIINSLKAIKETVEQMPYDRRLVIEDLIYSIEFDFLPPDLKDFVAFHKGLHNKRKGYEKWANRHFAKITKGSYYFYRVRYIEAVELLKLEKTEEAKKILQEIIDAEFEDVDIKARARQSIARLHYEDKKFKEAIEYYDAMGGRIDKQANAFLERGWANFFLNDYQKALGSLHSLQAPIYDGFFDAEKFVVRLLIYKALCMYDASRFVLSSYEKEYGKPVSMIKERKDLAESVRLVNALFWSVGFKQRYDFLQGVKEESKRAKGEGGWKASGLLDHVVEIYDLKVKEIDQVLTADTYDGLKDVSERLLEQDEQMSLLTYEVRLDELKRIKIFQSVQLEENEEIPLIHSDRIYWPFAGEFWTDEMPDFKFLVQNQCKSEVIR